jgi:ABC-type Mn2+/Zn2+ transport system permease subunit
MSGFFASEVMRAALMPALLIAVTASSISVMILAHRLSFLTVGVSHATLAGLGLAVTLSLPLLPTASATAVAVALLLAPMLWKRGLNEDAATGVLFAGAMALGIVLISHASRYEVDLFGLLFGNILTVSGADRHWLMLTAAIIMLSFLWGARGWWSIAFDAQAAAAHGLPVTFYRMLLYAVTGLTVVMCVKLAGIVLTTGLLVLPAACAWFWGKGLGGLWLLSLLFSITGTLIGLMISYAEDWPSGATVVLTLCVLFLASWGSAWLVQSRTSQEHST